jgi:hypothetical protein
MKVYLGESLMVNPNPEALCLTPYTLYLRSTQRHIQGHHDGEPKHCAHGG